MVSLGACFHSLNDVNRFSVFCMQNCSRPVLFKTVVILKKQHKVRGIHNIIREHQHLKIVQNQNLNVKNIVIEKQKQGEAKKEI